MSIERFKWPVVGHKSIVSYLQNSIINNKVAHAYLFFGPAGMGKTVVAESFVTSLVCARVNHADGIVPCGECDCCRQIANRLHPDMIWINRELDEKTGKFKKNISIEQIRELKNKLSLHPFLDSYKAVVIHEAQYLSPEAANALLKTLEEPTPKTVIILLVDNIAWMPQTIVSRCQVLKFLPVRQAEISEKLKQLGADKKSADKFASLAYGRPGIAIDYLSTPDLFQDYQQKIKDFLTLTQADLPQKFKFISSAFSYSDVNEVLPTLNIWLKTVRDLALIKSQNPGLVANVQVNSDLEKIASRYSVIKLSQIIKEIIAAKRYLSANVNPRLILENLILNF